MTDVNKNVEQADERNKVKKQLVIDGDEENVVVGYILVNTVDNINHRGLRFSEMSRSVCWYSFTDVSRQPLGPILNGPIERPETQVDYNKNHRYENL